MGSFLHMFWECSIITSFWSEVFSEINLRLQLSLSVTPELALLGVHDDAHCSHHLKLLISYLLFYAKKEILLKWISVTLPSLSSWEALIDAALPMYRLTYINRGCQWKYDKVWAPWAST